MSIGGGDGGVLPGICPTGGGAVRGGSWAIAETPGSESRQIVTASAAPAARLWELAFIGNGFPKV